MISLCAFSMDFCTILYRADAFTSPCLYVGTSLGSCLVIVLQLPQEGESRRTQPVIVSPSGNTYYFLFKTKIGIETTLLVVFMSMIVNVTCHDQISIESVSFSFRHNIPVTRCNIGDVVPRQQRTHHSLYI